jgi:hypothetical protein
MFEGLAFGMATRARARASQIYQPIKETVRKLSASAQETIRKISASGQAPKVVSFYLLETYYKKAGHFGRKESWWQKSGSLFL